MPRQSRTVARARHRKREAARDGFPCHSCPFSPDFDYIAHTLPEDFFTHTFAANAHHGHPPRCTHFAACYDAYVRQCEQVADAAEG